MEKNINFNSKKAKLILRIIFLTGILELLGAIYLYSSTSEFLTKAKAVNGKVIELVALSSINNNSMTYSPVFQFTDQSGKTHTIQSASSSNPPSYEVGEEVKIFFNPENPNEAKLNEIFDLWGASIILGIVALGSMFLSSIVFIASDEQ